MPRTLVASLAAAVGALALAGPAQATHPGANGRLAFQRPIGNQVDLFTIRADGTRVDRVLRSPVIEERPSWSPDGRRLAFARDTRDGATEIFTARPGGGDLRRVTRWGGMAGTPTWTPDGRIIAFTVKDFPPPASEDDPPPPSELYVIDPDGGGEVRLTNDTTIQTEPDVAPDGTVAFTQWQAVEGEPGVFDLGIGALAPGGAVATLAPFSAERDAFNPSWSPDGRRIVVEVAWASPPSDRPDGGRQSDIVVIDADGTNVRRLTRTPANEATPVWSPDGRSVAFASDRHVDGGPRERNSRDFELYTMRADGTRVRRLTRNRVPDLYPNWQAVQR